MKNSLFLVASLFATTVFGQVLLGTEPDALRKITGGWVIKPGTQRGEIAYVNCQRAAKAEWINEIVDYYRKACVVNMTLTDGSFDIRAPKITGNLTIFIVDDPNLPISLVAIESRWALVNVAKLKSEKEPFFRARVKKELSRVSCMLFGGFKSNYPNNLTSAIVDVKDLDTYVDHTMPVDVLNRFQAHLLPYGITTGSVSTYLMACQEGWAPQPTNEYQKAIWDKVHAIPSKPLKIEYNEKRDKGK